MRYIELKNLGVDQEDLKARLSAGRTTAQEADQEVREKGAALDYREIIIQVTKTVPNGIDFVEMQKHMRVIDAAERAGDVLALEDKDHELLVKQVRAYKWGVPDRNIITFCEDVINAPDSDPTALAEAAE
jgi:hypothetical protein